MENAVAEGALRLLEAVDYARLPEKNLHVPQLDKLTKKICQLRAKGFEFHHISSLLLTGGVDLHPDTIRDFFYAAHETRMTAYELLITESPDFNLITHDDKSFFLQQGLRESVKDFSGFVLHYQPQIDTTTGKIVGAEALLRWSFNGALIPPSEFIPLAENLDLIIPLGEWVLREACNEAKRWQSLGLGGEEGIKVGVNISAKQLIGNLPKTIKNILNDSGLANRLLGIEITESFLVNKNYLHTLHILKNRGIHLSIDDFGIGYSCLAQLKDLPIHTVKIDREFVKNIGKSRNLSILESIIDLAKKLGAKTLAEGVESEDEATALKKLGCTTFQGFLYSKPLSGEDFIKFVLASLPPLVLNA